MEKPSSRNSANKSPSTLSLSGELGGALSIHPGLTSRKRCIKSSKLKLETFSLRNNHFRKNAYPFKKFQAIFVRKTLYFRSHLSSITPAS